MLAGRFGGWFRQGRSGRRPSRWRGCGGAFDFAVGLGPVGPGVFRGDAESGADVAPQIAAVGPRRVSDYEMRPVLTSLPRVEYARHPDRVATFGVLGDAVASVEIELLEDAERGRVPLPHGRPESSTSCSSRGFDDRTGGFCRVTMAVSTLCQLVRDLRFVERSLADSQSAVPNELTGVSQLDRQQPEPWIRRQRIVTEPAADVLDRRASLGIDPPYRSWIPLKPQPAVLLGIRRHPPPQPQPLGHQLRR
jgi:hypothetical protein